VYGVPQPHFKLTGIWNAHKKLAIVSDFKKVHYTGQYNHKLGLAMPDAHVIRFTTSIFDVTSERPNPINPIAGESLLRWLRERARPHCEVSEPDAEDWGWYSSVSWHGRVYMLGASASDEEENEEREWVLQIVKQRSLGEKLLGRARITEDDECVLFFKGLLESERGFKGVSVDPEP
jgi:hypothetical protein